MLVQGATAEETLARLILAFASLLTAGAPVVADHDVVIEVAAASETDLAIDVLRELLYRFDVDRVIPESVLVERFDVDRGALVRVGVGPWDPVRHADGTELKAVTLHAARFAPKERGWEARIVFDI